MVWLTTLGPHAALGLGAYTAARFGLRLGPGPPRLLGAAVLAWAWLTVGLQALGSLGLFTLGPLAAWCGVGLAIGACCWAVRRGEREPRVQMSDQGPPLEAPGAIALGLAITDALVLALPSLLWAVKVVSDGPIYHLYFAAKWWRAGRLVLVTTPFGESAAPYFPGGGDLWFSWLMVVWDGLTLAKVGQAPFLALAAAATFAIARLLGAGRTAAAMVTAYFVTLGPLLLFSFEANVDTIFIAGYLVAVYFFLRSARGLDGGSAWFLAGLAAGCAWGTKPTGTLFVPPLLLAGAWIARSQVGWRALGLLALGVLLPTAYWYVGHLVRFGNLLYPLHVEIAGRVLLPGWYTSAVMARHPIYQMPISDWRAGLDVLLAVTDPRLAPLWLAALLGTWRWGRPGTDRDRLVWWCAGLALLNVALFWALVPYRTQQRFFLQAYGLAAVPLALTLDRARWARWVALVLLALHVLTMETWPFASDEAGIPWDLSDRVPNAVPTPLPVPQRPEDWRSLLTETRRWLSLVFLAVMGGLAIASAALWARPRSLKNTTLACLATIALLAHATALHYPWGQDARRRFYPPFDFFPGWIALEGVTGPAPAKVAYAGTNLPFYLMGVGLRHDVRYVNVNEHADWLLHDYHRQAMREGRAPADTPRPGWDREVRDEAAWLANLRAAGIQYLVVTRSDTREGPFDVHDAARFPIERAWADARPDIFALVYGEADPIFRIYRVLPPQSIVPE